MTPIGVVVCNSETCKLEMRDYAEFAASFNSCVGCRYYNDGDGSDVCRGCCRNYEEDYYEEGGGP